MKHSTRKIFLNGTRNENARRKSQDWCQSNVFELVASADFSNTTTRGYKSYCDAVLPTVRQNGRDTIWDPPSYRPFLFECDRGASRAFEIFTQQDATRSPCTFEFHRSFEDLYHTSTSLHVISFLWIRGIF